MESLEVRNAIEQGWMPALDIADYLGVTQQRVSQLAAQDGFPRPRSVEGRRLWKRSVIERWADRYWWGRGPGGFSETKSRSDLDSDLRRFI